MLFWRGSIGTLAVSFVSKPDTFAGKLPLLIRLPSPAVDDGVEIPGFALVLYAVIELLKT